MDAGFETRHRYAACRLTFTHNYMPGDSPGTTFGTGFVVGFPEGESAVDGLTAFYTPAVGGSIPSASTKWILAGCQLGEQFREVDRGP